MAKGNMFLSQARGKVGSVVFSVIRGQQVERVHNPSPANPQTYSQQAQRSLLANMTKFYRRGVDNFFKFAFEDRTTRESDFNAFARKNMQQGIYPTREQFDAKTFPALGNYLMTYGSIAPNWRIGWRGDTFGVIVDSSVENTIGSFSNWLLTNYPSINPGDIFTLVVANSDVDYRLTIPSAEPTWDVAQFIVDATDTRPLTAVNLALVDDFGGYGVGVVGMEIEGQSYASFGAVVISRNTDSGLKVSTSAAIPSSAGGAIIDWMRGAYQQRAAAISWGGNPDALLAGGQIATLPEITAINIGQVSTPAYIAREILGTAPDSLQVTIAGNGLKTTAQGGELRLRAYVGNLMTDISASAPAQLVKESTSTLTGSATSLTAQLTFAQFGSEFLASTTGLQGHYVLEYNGVPILYGPFVYAAAD